MSSPCEQLRDRLSQAGGDALLEELADALRAEGRFHELFDALLLAARRRAGVDLASAGPIELLPEPQRMQLEEASLAACREVGSLLLSAGRVREAWLYFRPTGEREPLASALMQLQPCEENVQELVEVALHEGVAPEWGYRLVLEHFGTCNAITAFEGLVSGRSRAEQQAAAALLIGQLHRELTTNLRGDIGRREGREPSQTTLPALLAAHGDLFGEFSYHVDTTHLYAVVRFARVVEEPAALELAWELTDYGRRLHAQFQFAGEEPFVEAYPSHGLFFAAQLGRQVDEAVEYFRRRAEEVNVEERGAQAAEVYVALLARLGRYAEAVEASARLLPPGTRQSGFAPSLVELARRAGRFEPLLAACESSGDLVGYSLGLLLSAQRAAERAGSS